MKKESIQDKLEKQLYSHFNETIREPTLIVMHRDTWYDLCGSIWLVEKMKTRDFDPSGQGFYKGIQVLRSLDVPVGLFEVR